MSLLEWLRGVRYKFVSGFRMVVGLGVGNDGDGGLAVCSHEVEGILWGRR